MNVTTQEATEFAAFFGSLVEAGSNAIAQAERYQAQYAARNNVEKTEHWGRLLNRLYQTQKLNMVKQQRYQARVYGIDPDCVFFQRQAD